MNSSPPQMDPPNWKSSGTLPERGIVPEHTFSAPWPGKSFPHGLAPPLPPPRYCIRGDHMQGYDAKDMARSFRTVRANTIQTAEEIPEESYGFRPAEGCRSVAETLAHIAVTPHFPHRFHSERITTPDFALFSAAMQRQLAQEAALTTKPQILEALRTGGEQFAAFLETLSDDVLSEKVTFPEGVEPRVKTRFELLLGAKEHEMHHRAQLMVAQRMLGIVPHLTRQMQARIEEFQQHQQKAQAAS